MFFEHVTMGPFDVALIEQGIKAATRANTFLALRSVIKFALEAKILAKPPVLMDLPKRAERVPTAPSVVDAATCIEAASCDEHRLVLLLAAHGGARRPPLPPPRVPHASTSGPSSRPITIHSAPVDVQALHVPPPRMLAFRSDSGWQTPALAEYLACGPRGVS